VCLEFSNARSSTNNTATDVDASDKLRERLERWVQLILWEKQIPAWQTDATTANDAAIEILRMKGAFRTAADPPDQLHIIQAVQEIYEIITTSTGTSSLLSDGTEGGKLVLIGRRLDAEMLRQSLTAHINRVARIH
jgi:hypothetical protein